MRMKNWVFYFHILACILVITLKMTRREIVRVNDTSTFLTLVEKWKVLEWFLTTGLCWVDSLATIIQSHNLPSGCCHENILMWYWTLNVIIDLMNFIHYDDACVNLELWHRKQRLSSGRGSGYGDNSHVKLSDIFSVFELNEHINWHKTLTHTVNDKHIPRLQRSNSWFYVYVLTRPCVDI